MDIGARFHVVGVPPDLCDEPVQTFQAFTGDIERMANWLVSIGIQMIAMESTGVYWVLVYLSSCPKKLDQHRSKWCGTVEQKLETVFQSLQIGLALLSQQNFEPFMRLIEDGDDQKSFKKYLNSIP